MKSKTMVYFGYIIKTSLILFAVIAITASSSKRQIYSSNENVNRNVDLSTMALFINKEEEERENAEALQKYLWGSLDSYTGDLTGYGADCPLCSGRLACMSKLDLSNGRNTYEDKTYGNINIVASSKNLPCGTIIRFDSARISDKPTIAIVLDRGVLGNDIDFLAPSEAYAAKYIGRSSITYDVLRFGWEK
ncbi:MAG: hypothetical protein HFI36_06500 [Bacilli bacterium]|jgi:hypothetical protein|nr:hypothetical protein [Bacilli bacterium]MCX4254001.1 hypothetical protein [Bacilli bacterium]